MPEHAREKQFWQNMRNTGGLNSQPGISSGTRPQRYYNNEEGERIYRAQFALLRDLDGARLAAGDFQPHDLPIEKTFDGLDAMQEYVNGVLANEWSRWRSGPPWPVKVQFHQPLMFAYRPGVILAPLARPLGWRELHVLHELGHHFSQTNDHSLVFVRAFLDLLATTMDQRVSDRMREYLTMNGVPT